MAVSTAPLGNPGVNNTAFLFGALAFGFAFWITARGDLPKWLGMLGLAGTRPGTGAPVNPASTTLQSAPSSPLPGVANPWMPAPGVPLAPGIAPPETGGGFGQY